MTLHRAVLLTADENTQLVQLLDAFHTAQTPSHDTRSERDAAHELGDAQIRIAVAHGLDPNKCGFGFSRQKDATWRVVVSYPLTQEEEKGVRGLG